MTLAEQIIQHASQYKEFCTVTTKICGDHLRVYLFHPDIHKDTDNASEIHFNLKQGSSNYKIMIDNNIELMRRVLA